MPYAQRLGVHAQQELGTQTCREQDLSVAGGEWSRSDEMRMAWTRST
jgi:hypothetical protein